MSKPEIVFAMYKPHAGQEKALESLVAKHFPLLKGYGLVTNRMPTIMRSKNGTILEIFEWESSESSQKAHVYPAIAKIWDEMGSVSIFVSLDSLDEAKKPFAHFAPLALASVLS